MKGVITILIMMLMGLGANAQQQHGKSRVKGGTKNVNKVPSKPQPAKITRTVAKVVKKDTPEVKQKIDTPEIAAMPADTGLITANLSVDTVRAEPEEIVIWKDPEETFAWLPWISLAVAVGMGVYVIWSNSNIRGRLEKIDKRKPDKWGGTSQDKVTPGISSLEVESLITSSPALRKIQDECSALRGMIEKLQPAEKATPVLNTPVAPVEEVSMSTFYMTGPTRNYFPANARSSYKENTLYKFVLQPGGNEAKFELHTMGASVSEIIKVIESYIKPACDEDNLPTAGTRNIVTKKPGIAILENEKWVIKSKAIIKYE